VDILNKKVLVLGGYGLVGTAVCRELLDPERNRAPREIQIHSLKAEESQAALGELGGEAEAVDCTLTTSHGDVFGLLSDEPRIDIRAQIGSLEDPGLDGYRLYRLLVESKPDVVIDCINTATAIAYRDVFSAAAALDREIEAGAPSAETADRVLEALYTPRLIRHVQVIWAGMTEAGVGAYIKVGTTGTGGLGLNIPYTHSEEKPSRTLLSKSAMAGAHSMLLCLMARTPGGPLVKEIKPAAAIAWKKIGYGPIRKKGGAIRRVEAEARPLGGTLSTTLGSDAGDGYRVLDEPMQNVYIDTGENGVFAYEEFSAVTAHDQMEFVTPEEIAAYVVREIEGHATGYDVVGALDGSVLGPSYRGGALRGAALERMEELQEEHGVASIAFEMLGPPRVSKLLFEAHLLRRAFATMSEVEAASGEKIRDRLNQLIVERPAIANEMVAIGIPVLLDDGRLIRGPELLVPADADGVEVTPERVELWATNGWADLRLANCEHWKRRFERIHRSWATIADDDSSSRFHRNADFWDHGGPIHPGRVVGWILSEEEGGKRIKR